MNDFVELPRKQRVLVIDSHVSVSEMLGIVLCREGFASIDEAETGERAVALLRKFNPDMVITALDLQDINGHALILALRKIKPELRVLVYTGTKISGLITAALEAKPQGFVHKTESLSLLRQAIIMVAQGVSFFSPYLESVAAFENSSGQLSIKERLVLKLVAQGMSSKEVAGQLNLSTKTIEHHRTQMMQKLRVTNVAHLTCHAVRIGLIRLD